MFGKGNHNRVVIPDGIEEFPGFRRVTVLLFLIRSAEDMTDSLK